MGRETTMASLIWLRRAWKRPAVAKALHTQAKGGVSATKLQRQTHEEDRDLVDKQADSIREGE